MGPFCGPMGATNLGSEMLIPWEKSEGNPMEIRGSSLKKRP